MGKGVIKSGGSGGEYQVELKYNTAAKDREINRLNAAIGTFDTKISTELDPVKKGVYKLQKISCQKRIDYINNNTPEDIVIPAWCADLTEDLTGEVGTIEVPGERGSVNIRPGFNDRAAYSSANGQLSPTVPMGPAGVYYNLAMMPGWQKWKPTFRYATITSLDGDIAEINLESIESSQQSLNVNQTTSIAGVEIEYMDCNGAAFEEGDEVLIKFEGQDWSLPKIVGFKDHPKPCGGSVILVYYLGYSPYGAYCFLWDVDKDCLLEDPVDTSGNSISFPCKYSRLNQRYFNGKNRHTAYPAYTRDGINCTMQQDHQAEKTNVVDTREYLAIGHWIETDQYTINDSGYGTIYPQLIPYEWSINTNKSYVVESNMGKVTILEDTFTSKVTHSRVCTYPNYEFTSILGDKKYSHHSYKKDTNGSTEHVTVEIVSPFSFLNRTINLSKTFDSTTRILSREDIEDIQYFLGGATSDKVMCGFYTNSIIKSTAVTGIATEYETIFKPDAQIYFKKSESMSAKTFDPFVVPLHSALTAQAKILKDKVDGLAGLSSLSAQAQADLYGFKIEIYE